MSPLAIRRSLCFSIWRRPARIVRSEHEFQPELRRYTVLRRIDFGVALLLVFGASELRSEELWRKHAVHEGLHTNTAVAGDFTKDGKPDIISNSGSKTRLFVAPDWREVILAEGNGYDFIHSEVFDVDGDGDLDWIGARYQPGWI